jgi:DMSO/TMAO reductase YedYZ molybdopterin-dependent catalytic subunit
VVRDPRLSPGAPPPGPFRPEAWRSPLRGPWLTTLLGLLLLGGVTVVAVTGFLSHAAYLPSLGANAIVPAGRDLPLTFAWPASPSWLYALTQGLHVNVGLITIPLLLAKLWSVIPRLFTWPPVTSAAHGIERLSLALLVGSALFEFATGVVNMQNWYPFAFSFVIAHYYGAVVFVASLAIHVVVKLPTMRHARRHRAELMAPAPAAPTISRRGLFGLVGAGSATLLVANAGETLGGPLRATALLAPRRTGGFPVNKTARAARITPAMVGAAWRLRITGPGGRAVALSREDLLALDLRAARLPIACVEGWTTTQEWRGVPLAALAALVGARDAGAVAVGSLQPRGVLRQATLTGAQFRAADALLALHVNGADLPLDHGYPARVIVPALPGVHNTKWVATLAFGAAT